MPCCAGDYEYDVVVVGSGTAGICAAKTAARFGAKVLMVNGDKLGGSSAWTGDRASKALCKCARTAVQMNDCERYGVTMGSKGQVGIDFKKVHAHIQQAMKTLNEQDESSSVLEKEGIEVH